MARLREIRGPTQRHFLAIFQDSHRRPHVEITPSLSPSLDFKPYDTALPPLS